jgi:hypothetical protein
MKLEYARGTVIPLSLVLESDDPQALDLLAKPTVPTVALMRNEHWDLDSSLSISDQSSSTDPQKHYVATHRLMHAGVSGMSEDAGFNCSAIATWWASNDAGAFGVRERRMDGEIHLPATLAPSFEFWKVAVEVKS